MPNEKLTQLQQAMIEHDDDMARLDRNTIPITESITVESCLAELRETFRGKWISLDVTESHTIGPRGKHSLEHSGVTLQVDSTSGDLVYNAEAHSLDEAMAQVRAWKESQND